MLLQLQIHRAGRCSFPSESAAVYWLRRCQLSEDGRRPLGCYCTQRVFYAIFLTPW